MGFPGSASGKEASCQGTKHQRPGFDPWVGKIPWEGNGNPLQLGGESQGQRNLVGYSP